MTNLENLIRIGEQLNNAIETLNAETSTLKNIAEEKRKTKLESMESSLQVYCDALKQLHIDKIDFHVGFTDYYSQTLKSFGIQISHERINLVVYSNVMPGFYGKHCLGDFGRKSSEILNIFLDNWNYISQNIESHFTKAVQEILNERTEKAIANREDAIKVLTKIN